jgi:hypothetical protein
MRIKRFRLPVLALGGLLAVAGVGVASGSIPSSSDGVIHGCYQKPGLLANPGAVRVIDEEAGDTCRNDETAFQWNSKGVKGDTGPEGPRGKTGPEGPAGPQGPSGVVSGRQTVTFTRTVAGSGNNAIATAVCPAGKAALTGGARVGEGPSLARLTMSEPLGSNAWRGQAIEVGGLSDLTWTLVVTVVCVDG